VKPGALGFTLHVINFTRGFIPESTWWEWTSKKYVLLVSPAGSLQQECSVTLMCRTKWFRGFTTYLKIIGLIFVDKYHFVQIF
jgi:hypothetical protein